MVDKNLFPYDLAVTAIFKNEAPYLAEWLDYHLLAGAEHFYLYNNDSSDNYAQVLAPYVAANLVTLIDLPGRTMQMPAYDDALEKFRFMCRYMAFIDLDEFIFPKTNQSIVEVADEILSRDENAAGLVINWQIFGSNGHEVADYSRGVLERFTRRAPSDWIFTAEDENDLGNIYVKSVVNPRCVDYFSGPHYAVYFGDLKSISSDGVENFYAGNFPIAADKIVVNHYVIKSLEECQAKINRLSAFSSLNNDKSGILQYCDRNEVFDDGILSYRAACEENFSLEADADKLRRVEKTLLDTLTQCSPLEAPTEFLAGKLETFLTCRALAEGLDIKIGTRSAEELAIAWIYQTLVKADLTHAEVYQFLRALPEILARPFPICRKLKQFTQDTLIPSFRKAQKNILDWQGRSETLQVQKLLQLIKYF
ncbi:MAG: glycosyltransferase family 92 protein [Quinella sp. 1Q7]|nr:glycosyltransferase family 92 protein [Quinella sp. 1Q7]